MSWFDVILMIFCFTSIGVNIYIIVYQIESHHQWYFMLSTALGIFFGFYRLSTVLRRVFSI